jgi:hypothetical protein
VLVAGMGFGWLDAKLQRARKNRPAAAKILRAVGEIRGLGGRVEVGQPNKKTSDQRAKKRSQNMCKTRTGTSTVFLGPAPLNAPPGTSKGGGAIDRFVANGHNVGC